jgi:hypothetical protein
MPSKIIVSVFIILILIAYFGFINSLNFSFSYKVILYIPAIFFALLFMFLGFRNEGKGGGSTDVGGFPYEY